MNDDLDALFKSHLLQPPADFTQRVMQNIQPLSRYTAEPRAQPNVWSQLGKVAASLGLVGGGLLGLSQLANFVLGVWLAGSAL